MNKLNKIFIAIIILLVIALGIMTYLYFDMRNKAQENLDAYVNVTKQIVRWNLENN